MLNPIHENNVNAAQPNVSTFDPDQALYDILNDPSLDPAWFDLDPTEYYSAAGNSCGFLTDVPNIVDEVDRDGFMQSIEQNAHRRSNSEAGLYRYAHSSLFILYNPLHSQLGTISTVRHLR